jgi:low temperature requirement protein LtrA
VDESRTVSFLELFYDLVFVVLVAQIAHTLAADVSWQGVLDFAVVFGLVWIAWLNGSMYHELHGREDGRSRTYIFVQMMLLVVLAVFAGHAADEDGLAFAIAYVALVAVLAWQWYVVRRYDDPKYHRTTGRYLAGMLAMIAVVGASIWVDEQYRLWMWAAVVLGWFAALLLQSTRPADETLGMTATESMAERFGLFTIIVLGEVVVGVVDGLIEADRNALTMATGLLALTIGFGFWWNYFDAIGRREPRHSTQTLMVWIAAHLPLTAAAAAAGAGMVSLIEHAGDTHTPAATAWLLSGSSALLLACLAILVATIDYDPRMAAIRPHIIGAQLVGVVVSLGIGLAAPQAWLLALLLSAVHLVIWFYVFAQLATRPTTTSPATAQ